MPLRVPRNYLDSCGITGVENPQMFLRFNGHVLRTVSAQPMECRPRLFRDRLQLNKIKLLLPHLDLGDVVIEHPRAHMLSGFVRDC